MLPLNSQHLLAKQKKLCLHLSVVLVHLPTESDKQRALFVDGLRSLNILWMGVARLRGCSPPHLLHLRELLVNPGALPRTRRHLRLLSAVGPGSPVSWPAESTSGRLFSNPIGLSLS